jgi:L-2-hydroxyglutarate oxidase LhgO
MPDFEIAVVGAGVVGLAIASRLSERHPNLLVLERNEKYGLETSSRNSEVIHAGIYYPPASLKARLCIEGRDELYSLARRHDIPHRKITKLIIAASADELPALHRYFENGRQNGAPLEILTAEQTHALEPNIRSVASIFSPLSGIISAHALMDFLYHQAVANGATIQQRCSVVGIGKGNRGYSLTIEESGCRSEISAEIVINSAGLHADTVAAMAGIDIDEAGYRLHYAKGSYFAVSSSKSKLVSRLVYPLPTNEGAGVHALLDWGGRLKFGPDVEYIDRDRVDYAVPESKRREFGEWIRRIVPSITDEDITPDMSGIRPKLQAKGKPPRDFVIVHEKEKGLEGFIDLIGIESPGLTASLAIARYVEELMG